MSKEYTHVVQPLIQWLKEQKADWQIYRPRYPVAATGWDIEARRKNQDLLIEAKYINGPFLASFNGLVTAPMANRRQHFMKKKYRSWSYGICWAIGSSYAPRSVYQILLDYFSRNLEFWVMYGKVLRMKYIFFVKRKHVVRLSWTTFIALSRKYHNLITSTTVLQKRCRIAELLIG